MAKCRSTTFMHGHPVPCDQEATETSDQMCKECHDKAVDEWATARPSIRSDLPPGR
jgi:hypothetical protein